MNNRVELKLEQFFSLYKFQHFSKGEILIRADEDPQGIYFLKKGLVKQYAISIKGEESIVSIFKPASFFPMSWALNRLPNKYYYEALTETEVLRAPADNIIEFLKQNPDVLFDLLGRIYNGLDTVMERMVYMMSGSAYSRLLLELMVNAKRFGTKVNKGSAELVEIEITEKELAAQTGLARETISRELHFLKKKKLVYIEKNKILINIGPLKEELAVN